MSTPHRSKREFLSELIALTDHPTQNSEQISQRLRNAIVDFGSETEDNLKCAEHLEVAVFEDYPNENQETLGISLKNSDLMVSDVFHNIEGIPVPEALKEWCPEITQADFDAALRLATLTFSALDRNIKDENSP